MRITKERLEQIIQEEVVSVLDEKRKRRKKRTKKKRRRKKAKSKAKADDRCTRIAKRKYDVWPSAYASGAVVKCRQGKIWKGISEGKDFEPHMMYCPRSGKSEMTKTKEDHTRLAKKGFVHINPDDLRKVLRDEGGASGLDPFVKATKSDEKEIKQALKMMPDVGQHKDGDYILKDDDEIKVIKELINKLLAEKKSLKTGQSQKEASVQKTATTPKDSQ